MPVAISASLTDTNLNDTERDNAMFAPKPSRDWSLIRKMAEDFDRQTEDDLEVSELTKFASSGVEAATIVSKESDHKIRDDVVENTAETREVAVAAGRARLEEMTRAGDGREHMADVYDALQQVSDLGQWRDGVAADDDRTMSNDIVKHQAGQVPQFAAREAVTLLAKDRQQGGHAGPGYREVDEPVRPTQPIRSDERPSANRTGLAVSDTADVRVRPRNDMPLPARAFAKRSMNPLKAYDHGDRLQGAVSTTRVEQALARHDHADSSTVRSAQWTAARDDRPMEARASYGHLPTTKNHTSSVAAGMRATPVQSRSLAGQTATCRIESKSVQSGTMPMAPSESGLQRNDRSTPTRALTPGLSNDHSRWTSTLQQNGQSRGTNNSRAFIGGDARIRTSTPDLRAGSARDI